MNILEVFFFGSMAGMELSSFRWWNGKRLEYNARFVGCLIFAQILFLITGFGLAENGTQHVISSLPGMLVSDLFLFLLVNIIYFLWPSLEIVVSKKWSAVYRKYCFAFINFISAMIALGALVVVSIANS